MFAVHRYCRCLSGGVGLLAVIVLASGCGSIGGGQKVDPQSSPVARHLERLGTAYLRATMRLNRPPANLKELTPDLKEQGNPSEILVSPIDKQPYEIVWGVELRRLKATGNDLPVVAYEKIGENGQRHVLRGDNDIQLQSESQLRGAKLPADYKLPF